MKESLRILGATALMSCLSCTAFAQLPKLVEIPPPTMTSISSKMTGVAGELAKTKTGEPVQDEQKGVLRDLDALIASLEKECEGCRAGMKKNNPRRGMPDSFISSGTGGIGDLVDPKESEKDWAKLSGRERDRILQSMSEGFPPEYRLVLERYYRRLAEEKTVAPGSSREQTKDKDAAPKSDKP